MQFSGCAWALIWLARETLPNPPKVTTEIPNTCLNLPIPIQKPQSQRPPPPPPLNRPPQDLAPPQGRKFVGPPRVVGFKGWMCDGRRGASPTEFFSPSATPSRSSSPPVGPTSHWDMLLGNARPWLSLHPSDAPFQFELLPHLKTFYCTCLAWLIIINPK